MEIKNIENYVGVALLVSGLFLMAGFPTEMIGRRIIKSRYEVVSASTRRHKTDGALEFRYNHNTLAYDYDADGNLDFQVTFYPYRLCGAMGCTTNHPTWDKRIQLAYSEEFAKIKQTARAKYYLPTHKSSNK